MGPGASGPSGWSVQVKRPDGETRAEGAGEALWRRDPDGTRWRSDLPTSLDGTRWRSDLLTSLDGTRWRSDLLTSLDGTRWRSTLPTNPDCRLIGCAACGVVQPSGGTRRRRHGFRPAPNNRTAPPYWTPVPPERTLVPRDRVSVLLERIHASGLVLKPQQHRPMHTRIQNLSP
jgi:hypothetical protein